MISAPVFLLFLLSKRRGKQKDTLSLPCEHHTSPKTISIRQIVNHLQGSAHNISLQLYRQIPIRMAMPTLHIASNVA